MEGQPDEALRKIGLARLLQSVNVGRKVWVVRFERSIRHDQAVWIFLHLPVNRISPPTIEDCLFRAYR
jgi:hypothetical protein